METIVEYATLEHFLESTPTSGQVCINHNGIPIDMLIQNSGYKNTVFYFHAALGNIPEIPLFLGRGISNELQSNAVFISDPSLSLHTSLRLAWYSGSSRQPDLQGVLCKIIRHLSNELSGSRPPIFFGSSGGGYASLLYSSYFPESVGVAVNPQTIIRNYLRKEIREYCSLAWNTDEDEYDPILQLPVILDLTELYCVPTTNRIIYIQNEADTNHVINHRQPFYDKFHPTNDLKSVNGDWGNGHRPPPKDITIGALRGALASPRATY